MKSSVFPFLYPSVSGWIAHVGSFEMGEGCPVQGRAGLAAHGYFERVFPPESDGSIETLQLLLW